MLQQKTKGKEKKFVPITISDEGLETIEWISLDCENAEKTSHGTATWRSNAITWGVSASTARKRMSFGTAPSAVTRNHCA